MFGPTSAGVHATRPSIGQSDRGYYYVVLAAAVLCSIFVVALTRGRLGRLLRALVRLAARARHPGHHHQPHPSSSSSASRRSSPGSSARSTRGFVGSINGTSFPAFNSLTILALVVLVARRRAVVRDHRRGRVPADPRLRHRRQTSTPTSRSSSGSRSSASASRPGTRPRCRSPLRRFLDRLGGRRPEAPAAPVGSRPSPPCPNRCPAAVRRRRRPGSRSSTSPSGTAASWPSTA